MPVLGCPFNSNTLSSSKHLIEFMRICILGSGSSGNATLIVAGETRILIDCGLSGRETVKRMQAMGEDPTRLDAIVVTHEHGDHMRGLLALSKTLKVPVYISSATLDACKFGERTQEVRRGEAITPSQEFEIGSCKIRPFPIPHDAADPMAFTVEAAGVKMGIAVDLGEFNSLAAEMFRGSDVLILEANHEVDMLRACEFYPWSLKQRIIGRQGHTSNDEVARFLRDDFDGKAQHVILAHLSRNTNAPAIAKLAAVQALEARSTPNAEQVVSVAPYQGPGDWIEL